MKCAKVIIVLPYANNDKNLHKFDQTVTATLRQQGRCVLDFLTQACQAPLLHAHPLRCSIPRPTALTEQGGNGYKTNFVFE